MNLTSACGRSVRTLVVAAVLVALSLIGGGGVTAQVASDRATKARLSEGYGNLPLSFEANQGQTDRAVKFLSRGSGYSLFLTSNEAVLALRTPQAGASRRASLVGRTAVEAEHRKSAVLRMALVHANPQPRVTGHDELPGKSNYFTSPDPAKWRTGISNYASVRYEGMYPGIDLVYYGNQRQLEYDFVVAPGADPGRIRLSFAGAQDVRIDKGGDLVLRVAGGELRQHKPVVYQEVAGVRKEIAGSWVMRGKQQVGFEISRYDASLPLVIDPTLVYSTYLGGSGTDLGFDIAVDSGGNAYVTGGTESSDFPATVGAFDSAPNGSGDAFVTKLNPAGSALVYSTYLGGSNDEEGAGIAVDSAGNAYVAGGTGSSDFPTSANAFDTTFNSTDPFSNDVFVTKVNPTGSALLYSTFLGGSGTDQGHRIAVDGSGNAYVTGNTNSAFDFPTTAGTFDPAFNGGVDALVAKLHTNPLICTSAPIGNGVDCQESLVYSTFLGGSTDDYGFSLVVDSAGAAYVVGGSDSSDFPTTPGAFDTIFNSTGLFLDEVFVTKVNPTGAALDYSTYLGGSGDEVGFGIAVDSGGNAYVTGFTNSAVDFPTTPGAFATTFNGLSDAFVTKVNAAGSALVYSTYLGGSGADYPSGNGIAVDGSGNAYVTGRTESSNFPVTPDAIQPANAGSVDVYVTKFNNTGSALVYSTYLGGTSFDEGRGIAVDSAGSAYVTGDTTSSNFPTTAGAFDLDGDATPSLDALVAKISSAGPLPTLADQCKNGGWKTFGVFKNQGDCVSFVSTGGQNTPANLP